ncbi:hypothetical protein V6N13_100152 [Hibiscus sabdariffa]
MLRNKYAHVYLKEIVDEHLPDSNVEISIHVETVRNVKIVRNVETKLPIDAETVKNTESEQSDSEDEDTYYVCSESEQFDSPIEDNDNDLVDDDLLCDVQVGVGKIKTYVEEHNCVRDTKNMNCTSRWLAKEYLEKFRVDPNYSAKSLKHDVP